MSDRKIINKYYPIDFDPSKLTRRKRPKSAQTKVRMALPMSIRCSYCSNFMARNTKFNARKETVAGESYLQIPVYRLYFRCSRCFAEITIKTDPAASDYVCEMGAIRSYELHKEEAAKEEERLHEEELLDGGDLMKSLEAKSIHGKLEMAMNEEIDAVLWRKSKRTNFSAEEMYQRALSTSRREHLDLEDDSWNSEEDQASMEMMMTKSNTKVDHILAKGEDGDRSLSRKDSQNFGQGTREGRDDLLECSATPRESQLTMDQNVKPSKYLEKRLVEDQEEEQDPLALRNQRALEKLKRMRMDRREEKQVEGVKNNDSILCQPSTESISSETTSSYEMDIKETTQGLKRSNNIAIHVGRMQVKIQAQSPSLNSLVENKEEARVKLISSPLNIKVGKKETTKMALVAGYSRRDEE